MQYHEKSINEMYIPSPLWGMEWVGIGLPQYNLECSVVFCCIYTYFILCTCILFTHVDKAVMASIKDYIYSKNSIVSENI